MFKFIIFDKFKRIYDIIFLWVDARVVKGDGL